MEIGLTILGYLLPVLASVLTLLAIAGARKLLEKLGIERTEKVDSLIDKYVRMGVNAAESASKNYLKLNGSKMPSEDKKIKAVEAVLKELEQSGIKGVGEELIVNRIEHWLFEGKEEKAGEPT